MGLRSGLAGVVLLASGCTSWAPPPEDPSKIDLDKYPLEKLYRQVDGATLTYPNGKKAVDCQTTINGRYCKIKHRTPTDYEVIGQDGIYYIMSSNRAIGFFNVYNKELVFAFKQNSRKEILIAGYRLDKGVFHNDILPWYVSLKATPKKWKACFEKPLKCKLEEVARNEIKDFPKEKLKLGQKLKILPLVKEVIDSWEAYKESYF